MVSIIQSYPELLDLSKQETAICIFLDKEGASSARTISERCHIPFPRIYRILHKLQLEEILVSWGKPPKLYALRSKEPGLTKSGKRA